MPEIDSRQQIKYGNRNLNLTILGTTPNYADVHLFNVDAGRMFNESDDAARRRVAVLGSGVPGMLQTDSACMVMDLACAMFCIVLNCLHYFQMQIF